MTFIRPASARPKVSLLLFVLLILNLAIFAFPATTTEAATEAQVAQFRSLWSRTDDMVYDGIVQQPWVWGPKALDYTYPDKYRYDTTTDYTARAFRHYDKGRMEIDPRRDTGDKWYIRSGSLVREMVLGQVQTGELQEFNAPNPLRVNAPANIPIAGDPIISDSTPTYATFTNYATLFNDNKRADARGSSVTKLINRTADTVQYDSGDPKAKIDTYEAATGHNIPAIFSAFMKRQGQLLDASGKRITGALFDPIYHFGYPITEAYWARVPVAGKLTYVMFQLFERRTLTYTPTNPAEWQVEMGNVGKHYIDWRRLNDLSFSGPPRIGLDKFTSVLKSYGSPVVGDAPEFYAIITNFGLDPGVALGFFVRESGAGTAVGYCDGQNSLDNKNWGNARGDGNGVCGFQKFATWKDGLIYWCRIMSRDYVGKGLDRLERAIPVYAPTADGNDTNEYLRTMYMLLLKWQGYKV